MKILPNSLIELETDAKRPRIHRLKLGKIIRIIAAAIGTNFYLIYKKNENTEILLEISKEDGFQTIALLINTIPPRISVSNSQKEITYYAPRSK